MLRHVHTKQGDLCDFECCTVVGARRAALNSSQTADLVRFFYKTISGVYRKWSKKVSGSSLGQYGLLIPQVKEELPHLFDKKATASKLTTIYNQDVQKNGEWTGS